MFQLSDLSKSYSGRTLFKDVTWRINPGDRWGLVGPNGVGKTTMLRCFIGEEIPDTGQVTQPKTAKIGYLAQEVQRLAGASVLDAVTNAIPEVGELERQMRALEEQMATAPPAKAEELSHQHADLQDRFNAIDGYQVETRAKQILAGLGFKDRDLAKTLGELSGGWGMRVALARLLLARPDLLLLDEPTNHLDLESVVWLEEFLADYKGAWVVVSHDRYFLNRMVDGIAELSNDGIALYAGSYDDYLEEREERMALLQKAADAQGKKIAETERFIERFRFKASKARAAQSRIKSLAKIDRIEGPKRKKRVLRIRLPDPPRAGDDVISITAGKKAYGDNVVYKDLEFAMRRGDRLAFVGPNGAGKSTLLKLLAAATHLDAGGRKVGHNVSIYYYAQHQTEVLDREKTVLQELRETMPLDPESTVRGLLGAFLFTGDDVEKKISVLSGGEKARVALAKMLAKPANLLLLDEPTNHLDLASREVLESALSDFKGSIAFISHDRYFINSVATKIVEVRRDPSWDESKAVEYVGDYDYWQWKRAQEEEAIRVAATAPALAKARGPGPAKVPVNALRGGRGSAPGPAKAEPVVETVDYSKRKDAKREDDKRKKQVVDLEKKIEDTERRMKEIDTLLADPAVYADAARCKTLMEERGDLDDALLDAMTRWEELSAATT